MSICSERFYPFISKESLNLVLKTLMNKSKFLSLLPWFHWLFIFHQLLHLGIWINFMKCLEEKRLFLLVQSFVVFLWDQWFSLHKILIGSFISSQFLLDVLKLWFYQQGSILFLMLSEQRLKLVLLFLVVTVYLINFQLVLWFIWLEALPHMRLNLKTWLMIKETL